MINYNQQKFHTLELGIGLTCCGTPPESELVKIWSRHRKALLNVMGNLQGLHVMINNQDIEAKVFIRELDLTLPITDFGHLWYLLEEGTYSITVSIEG